MPIEHNIISLDQVGATGNMYNLYDLHHDAIGAGVRNIEILGNRGNIQTYINEANDLGLHVVSIHGPTGGILDGKRSLIDSAKLFAINHMFAASLDELLEFAPNYAIVTHAPYTRDPSIKRKIIDQAPFIKCWFIENHEPGLVGIRETAYEVISLRRFGVNAKLLFDGSHFLGAETLRLPKNQFLAAFDTMLDVVEKPGNLFRMHDERGNGVEVGIHFPASMISLGGDPEDTFPMEVLDDSRLMRFVKLLNTYEVLWRVWEHQMGGIYKKLIVDGEWMLQAQQSNKIVFDRLLHCGYFHI